MKNRVVSATEFKAKCLALLDEVEEQGGTITVTKTGAAGGHGVPCECQAMENPRRGS